MSKQACERSERAKRLSVTMFVSMYNLMTFCPSLQTSLILNNMIHIWPCATEMEHPRCFFSRVHATLLPAKSVSWPISWSITYFYFLYITAPARILYLFITAHAHLNATWVVVYPALFFERLAIHPRLSSSIS